MLLRNSIDPNFMVRKFWSANICQEQIEKKDPDQDHLIVKEEDPYQEPDPDPDHWIAKEEH